METTKDKVKGTIGDVASMAHRATDAGAGRLHQATDTAADRAREGTDKAAGVVSAIGEKAHDVAAAVGDYATQAKESVQHMASSAASKVEHAGEAVRDWTSDAVQHPGQYLKAGGDELTSLVRRYPIPALLVGIGIGFLLAKATSSSSRS